MATLDYILAVVFVFLVIARTAVGTGEFTLYALGVDSLGVAPPTTCPSFCTSMPRCIAQLRPVEMEFKVWNHPCTRESHASWSIIPRLVEVWCLRPLWQRMCETKRVFVKTNEKLRIPSRDAIQ